MKVLLLNNTWRRTEKNITKFQGINNIDTSTLLGKQIKAESSKIVESIISAEINHARQVKDTPFTPLDLNEKRFEVLVVNL